MNKQRNYLDNMTVPLTTSAAQVTVPADLSQDSSLITIGCRSAGAFVEWEMIPNGKSGADGETYPNEKKFIPMEIKPGKELFQARVASGTGTLEIGFWI
ncbi:MAG: hypothetical protein MI802_20255 [Desulfobacterales bacterium]|nr:hypothetical protein [Desulfobacterales bacterium]